MILYNPYADFAFNELFSRGDFLTADFCIPAQTKHSVCKIFSVKLGMKMT